MSQDLIQRAAQLAVDMKEMADLHASNGDTPAAEEFSQGADLVAAMAGEIVRLQAVEGSVIAMTGMLKEREWAEHVGKGAASDLECAITQLHGELAEAQKDADRHRFARDLVTSEEFQIALEPHIEWLSEEDDPATAEEHDAVTDRVIQIAKDHGLWPFKPKRELTDEAQAERWAFEELGGCSCFNGCAPCSHCTHPGNPLNQEEDPSCWKVLP